MYRGSDMTLDLPDLDLWRPIACDTETSGLHPDDGARTCVVSIAWEEGGEYHSRAWPFDQRGDKVNTPTLWEENVNCGVEDWNTLISWLSVRPLVFHNAKFDLHMLRTGTRHAPGVDLIDALHWDTMLASRELEPTLSAALKEIGLRKGLTGGDEKKFEAALKAWLKRSKLPKGRYDLVPWDIIGPYAALDAELTIRLYHLQQEEVAEGLANPRWINLELRKLACLYRMEMRGIGFEVGSCVEAGDRLESARNELAKTLPFAPSVNAAKRFFFDRQNVLPYNVTPTGQPQLAADDLTRMVGDEVPWAKEYQRWRHYDNALSMWYRGYPEKVGDDGRLRTVFRQTHVVSGRMSVERVQLQAIPHRSKLDLPEDVPTPRQFFQPAPGYLLWEVDLAQAELRIAARFAECKRMIELIASGADLHGDTAVQLFKVDQEHERWFFYRQIAKRANFSLIFGVGWRKFQDMVRKETGTQLSDRDCQQIVEQWRALYPEYQKAVRAWERFALDRNYVPLVNGRKRWFGIGEEVHKAFNQRVQASLAEFANVWMMWAERIAEEEGGRLVLAVHDSTVLEMPESVGDAAARRVAEIARDKGTEWFKLPFDADYGPWGEH